MANKIVNTNLVNQTLPKCNIRYLTLLWYHEKSYVNSTMGSM